MATRPLRLTAPIIRAELVATDKPAHFSIEAAGLRVTDSRYPINRLARVLYERGVRGRLDIYGPSADGSRIIHRMSVDIEAEAANQLSETDVEGFRRFRWTKKSLAALERRLEPIPAAEGGHDPSPAVKDATTASVRSSGEGIGRNICARGVGPPAPDEVAPDGVGAPGRGGVLTQSTAKTKGPQT